MGASGVNPAYRSFTVPILQDSIDENNESFTIEMSHFTGCFDASLSDKRATVTITDDDVASDNTPSTSGAPQPETSTHPPTRPTVQASPPKGTSTPKQGTAPGPSTTDAQTFLTVAEPDGGGGGLTGGGVVAIVVGVVAVGGASLVWVRRRRLT